MRYWQVALLSLFFILTDVLAHSRDSLHINNYGIADGLPDSTINAIAQDSLGFMWFGTDDGLVRYDGVKFKKYNAANGLNNRTNKVTQIFVDAKDNLWVTFDCSIHVLFADEQSFTYVHGFADINAINKSVNAIAQLSPNIVTVLTSQGAFLFNTNFNYNNPQFITSPTPLIDLVQINDTQYFIGNNEVYTLPANSNTFVTTDAAVLPDEVNITSALSFNNLLYIGTQTHGLFILDQYFNLIREFTLSPASQNIISHEHVSSLTIDNSQRLWVGLKSHGLVLLQANTLDKTFRFDPSDPHSITTNFINALYTSDNGDVWIGTDRGGINHFRASSEKLYHLKHSVLQDSPLSGNDVTAIAVDKYQRGWMASNSDGISVYNPDTYVNIVINQQLAGLKVAKLHIENQYAWALDEVGITKIDVDTLKVVSTYTPVNSDLPAGNLMDWLPINNEQVLLSHQGNGISIFTLSDLSFTHYTVQNSQLPTNQFGQMININGQIWISSNLGVHLFDPEQHTFSHFLFTPEQNINLINHITSNSDKHIVLSSNNGVHVFDPLTKKFVPRNFPDELASMNIQATLVTEEGVHWSTLKNGLIEYQNNSRRFSWYTEADGLQGSEFNPGVAYKNIRGMYVFSGLNGITVLNPNALVKPDIKLQISEMKVLYQDGSEAFYSNIHHDSMIFDKAIDVIQIDLGDVNFSTHNSPQFEYFTQTGMTKFDDFKLVFSPKAGSSTINIVNPLSTFDNFIAPPVKLNIEHPIPWHSTSFGIIAIVIAIIAAVYGSVAFRIRQVKRTAKKLAQLVKKRTDDLRRQTEISRLQAEKLALTVAEKDSIFETISHELRTPLTLIQGPVQQLRNYKMEPEAQTMLNILVRNADRLNTLVKKVFELSISDKLPTSTANAAITDLSLVIRQLANIFTPYTEQRELTFRLPEFAPLKVTIPLYNLETILSNLLSNAVKYTQQGGEISIEVEADAHFVSVHITDTGVGIADHEIPLIFNRFYRSQSEHVDIEDGTGLGLAIVEQLVDKADGLIKVSSEVDIGTRFSVIFPNTLNQTYQPSNVDVDKPCILCIDDNEDILTYLENLFKHDYQVHTANSSIAGLTIAKDLLPDLIISDIMMPEMDGIEVLNALKSDHITNHIPVILLTAKSSQASRMEGLASAASDYINKPFEEEELRLKTRNIIAEQESIRRRYIESVSTVEPEHKFEDQMSSSKFIHQLNNILLVHYNKPDFTVQDLANLSGMSDRQLLRRLKNETGIGASEFIRNFRLNIAADLLKAGKPASFAAYEAGFTSPSYFSTSFKKLFKITPKQFSKKQKLESIIAQNT
ncbi:MAG: hybrid sensor histidine kinase/response regulator transcription factor [Glaciecola sp.]